jgi:RNA polymerase sigma-70 factor (ECF subfamily)
MTGEPPSDIGGFGEIALRHEAYLRRVAVRLSGDHETARDLVQETLARALLHFGKFEQGTSARAWLTTILTRLYFDHMKHEAVVTRAQPELVTLEVLGSDLDMTITGTADAAVSAAVQLLEPDLRAVIECCYMQEMSYKQIADQLQLPIGTVSTRLLRARHRLKELLTQADAVKP